MVIGNLTLDADVERLVAEAQNLAGPIDIVINNAGGSGGAEDWNNTRAATWASAFDGARSFGQWLEAGRGAMTV